MLDFEIPYTVDEIDAACNEAMQANNLVDCYVRPIAWRGSEQMGVSAQLNKIHLAIATWEWGSYFDPQGAAARHPHRFGAVSPARSRDHPRQGQGHRPVHDLHHREAPRREGGLRRCADVRLARPRGRMHGRQYLLRQGWRPAYADARLFPRRHHPPHGHGPCQAARHCRARAHHHARGAAGVYRVLHRRHGRGGDAGRARSARYNYQPGRISEQLLNDYMAAVQPAKKAAE